MSGDQLDLDNTTETELVRRLGRVLGYVPVGTLDLLHVLTHPDVIADTRRYIEARGEVGS